MDQLPRLQRWLRENCGDEPHEGMVSIFSTNDGGWAVVIDIDHTPLANRAFERIEEGPDPDVADRWLSCSVTDGSWVGVCDSQQLRRTLDVFLDWASSPAPAIRR
jgi:hypothetical protein